MTEQEKWEEEFEEWFRQQDPEPSGSHILHADWSVRFYSAKLGYLAARRKGQDEIVIILNKVANSISRIPASCNCKNLNKVGHQDDCRWKGLYDAEQLVRKEAK